MCFRRRLVSRSTTYFLVHRRRRRPPSRQLLPFCSYCSESSTSWCFMPSTTSASTRSLWFLLCVPFFQLHRSMLWHIYSDSIGHCELIHTIANPVRWVWNCNVQIAFIIVIWPYQVAVDLRMSFPSPQHLFRVLAYVKSMTLRLCRRDRSGSYYAYHFSNSIARCYDIYIQTP